MVCSECGARVPDGAERCDLCGTAVQYERPVETSIESSEDSGERTIPVEREKIPAPGGPVACPACGRLNSTDATFCDQCATPLRGDQRPKAVSVTSKSVEAKRKHSRPRKRYKAKQSVPAEEQSKSRVGLLIIAGVVVVAALYGITVMSKSSSTPAPQPMATAPAQQQTDPSSDTFLPEDDELAAQAESIRSTIAETGDPEQQLALRGDLVELYATNGRLDLAGREQVVIAERRNTAADWTLAGDLQFDWMEQQSGTERVKAAQRAAASYQKALELEPDNLDVRTDLGVAYLNDPASPMLAIQETNAVLEANPDHVQANFNKGVMLLQIGRQAEAIERFEKVRDLTEPGEPAHDRAIEVLEQIRRTSG